jgi:methyltransferase (TIGR00027 family)
MNLKWPGSTNKGTALLKLLHQREQRVLVRDDYIGWYLESESIEISQKPFAGIVDLGESPEQKFQRIAYWFTEIREKYFDDIIKAAIEDQCKQLVLLGAGYDTRYLRLQILHDEMVRTIEVDRADMIAEKTKILSKHLQSLPRNLVFIPMDFSNCNLSALFDKGLKCDTKTVCIWQGVSYYLARDNVTSVIEFVKSQLPAMSVLGFDCCTPLMTYKNDQIPGIDFNIRRMEEIGEPYVFGMEAEKMRSWLDSIGFKEVKILTQNELAKRYQIGMELPNNMWYVVTAKC